MNKYLILFVCVCMAGMFYILENKINKLQKIINKNENELCHTDWVAERNRVFVDNNFERINRKLDNYDNFYARR